MSIDKAVITAGGHGTRFLPVTKAQPKEMMAVGNKPVIQHIIEEAIDSGLTNIIIVTGREKWSIERHFERDPSIERDLKEDDPEKYSEYMKTMEKVFSANIAYVRQGEARGLADAILKTEPWVKEGPFAILLGDDLVKSEIPCIKQLTDSYGRTNNFTVAVTPVPEEERGKYGIVKASYYHQNPFRLASIVEKPATDKAPSEFAVVGRYVMTPDIFRMIRGMNSDRPLLTDAITMLVKEKNVQAHKIDGDWYPITDPESWQKAAFAYTRIQQQ